MALVITFVPGYTFTDGEVITTAKLNLLGNPTINLLGSISTLAIADGSVTTPKLVDGVLSADAAGRAKMADGFLSADATGRGKMANGFVTATLAEESFREGCNQFAVVGSGSTTTYTAALNPAATSYAAGMRVCLLIDVSNTAAATLNLNGLGAKAIKSSGTVPLVPNQLLAGQLVTLIYDGTNFQLAGGQAQFVTAATAISAGAMINVAHGLPAKPRFVRWVIRCINADSGYAVGDELDAGLVTQNFGSGYVAGLQGNADATNLTLVCTTTVLQILQKGTPWTEVTIAPAKWNVVGYASL